jgi:TPR repeat protein
MADVVHDSSGPASSKPGDIARQQASRPDSDKGKLRVFISYSRDDLKFADQLDAALNACGFDCLVDRHDISGGEDWKRRLGNLISDADTVVFVLSPSSARSEICDWEVEEAARLNKRILPVNCRPLAGVSPPQRLRELNYIFFYDEPKVSDSGFGTGLADLVTALNTDFDWLREHTRYLQRAIEWDTGGRPSDRLLSGNDILEAKAWVARRPKGAPEPTALHLAFIRSSEEEAEARLSEQRKQLEAVAAAQGERETALHKAEEALKQVADAQRRRARIRNIAFVVVSIFAVLAVLAYWNATQQRKVAEAQRKQAEAQREQADHILGSATNIIAKLQTRMDDETMKEAFALFRTGAEHGDANSISNLGALYDTGRGVAQDYGKARESFEKAAAKGNANAMAYLGVLYENGQGVAQDYGKAREWYKNAAAKGNANAMGNLGSLYENGRGVTRDYGKAREWYEKAAAKDSTYAMGNLGSLYENGRGVAQDYGKAREWFEKAATRGDTNAKEFLEELPVHEAVTAGRYDEALRLEQTRASKVEAVETKRGGKPGEQTADALRELTWFALFAKDFTKALAVADRAHALFPDNMGIETNRAHALMFLGHDEAAKALYLAHKGEPVSEADNSLWEQVIAEDFAELRKAGLTTPMMADIEKELRISP